MRLSAWLTRTIEDKRPMLDRNAARDHYREEIETIEKINDMMSVLKTEGGHLTRAGIQFIHTGINRGLSQAQIARILEVSSATVSNHANG
jgi:hypothetical protein